MAAPRPGCRCPQQPRDDVQSFVDGDVLDIVVDWTGDQVAEK
jgi:hypothetical protein